MKTLISVILMMTAQGAEMEEPSQRFTVGEWRKVDEYQQKIAIIGGIEAVLLATSGPDGDKIGIDANCLANSDINKIRSRLQDESVPETSLFVYEMVEATECYSQS